MKHATPTDTILYHTTDEHGEDISVIVEYTYTPGFSGNWEEPPSDAEVGYVSVTTEDGEEVSEALQKKLADDDNLVDKINAHEEIKDREQEEENYRDRDLWVD